MAAATLDESHTTFVTLGLDPRIPGARQSKRLAFEEARQAVIAQSKHATGMTHEHAPCGADAIDDAKPKVAREP